MDKIKKSVIDAALEDLNDIADYTGNAGKVVAVNSSENGMKYTGSPAKIVYDDASFIALFERTAENTYKMKTTYKTVCFKINSSGGYDVADLLSDGDTWANLYTNTTALVEFENGAYIDFANERGYFEIDTDDCYLKNVDLRGTGTVASAVVQSYLLNAERVTFDNCKCGIRLSNVDMMGFQGSVTALHNLTSRYVNCTVYDLDGSDKIYGFKDCMNLTNCVAYDLESTGNSVYGFSDCFQLSNCVVYDLDSATNIYGFEDCERLSSCIINDGYAVNEAYGFKDCDQISGCKVNNIDSIGRAYGFYYCNQLSACHVYDVESSGGDAYGFRGCGQISGCKAEKIYNDATVKVSCGFYLCEQLSACFATDIVAKSIGYARGFDNCNYGASLYTDETDNMGNDYMDTVDANITNKVSCPNMFT